MTLVQLDRYIASILSRRWLVVALAALLMLVMTAGARFITVTNDYRSLFDEDNPQLVALDALEETYSASNAALIAIAPREGSNSTGGSSTNGLCTWSQTRFSASTQRIFNMWGDATASSNSTWSTISSRRSG